MNIPMLAVLLTLAGSAPAQIDPPIVQNVSYCAMDYFGYRNLFLPCRDIPMLHPRTSERTSRGEYGPYLEPGQDI